MKIQAIRHPSGKRVFVGTLQAGVKPRTGFVQYIAKTTGIAETSAREILTQGKTRKNWSLQTMQRQREPMIITYRLTETGKAYALRSEGAFGAFLRHCEEGEASDISEKLLSLGYEKHTRQRVTIDAARAKEKGLLEVVRKSNKI
jgi:hypothetical protein